MRRKTIIWSILIFWGAVLCHLPVFAAEDTSPEKNPLCWEKNACIQARQELMGAEQAAEGWIQESPCTGDWGKCLAGGTTETQITFAGQKTFTNVGVFIRTIYNYSILVIGIIAVVVIIISGLQWSASAGNSETISSAKKRIGGALIGSFIAFMSYVILNAVNPATVNLRLPQTWMTRAVPMAPKWCQEYDKVPDDTPLKLDDAWLDQLAPSIKTYDIRQYKGRSILKKDTICGLKFNIPGSSDVCLGQSCQNISIQVDDERKICGTEIPCACSSVGGYRENYCRPAFLGGMVTLVDARKYVNNITMWVACQSEDTGKIVKVVSLDSDEVGEFLQKNYAIYFSADIASKAEMACGLEENVVGGSVPGVNVTVPIGNYRAAGIFLTAEVEDTSFGPTIDDDWLVGIDSCGNGKKPLAGFNPTSVEGALDNSSDLLSTLFEDGQFWTFEQLTVGFTCDLNINPANYPNLDDDDVAQGYYLP